MAGVSIPVPSTCCRCKPIWVFAKRRLADLDALAQWLLERALEHDKPTLLLQLACEQLRREGVVRPGITRLEPLVATARHQAQEETYRCLLPLLIPSRRTWLDALLEPETDTGRTRLAWLRANATAATAAQIRAGLDKIAFLQQNGVTDWDLASSTPTGSSVWPRSAASPPTNICSAAPRNGAIRS